MYQITAERLKPLRRRLWRRQKTIADLSRELRVSGRTVYRYLSVLENAGYEIVRRKRLEGGFVFEIIGVLERG